MHGEAEIKKAIGPLLDRYGSMNTAQVKNHLYEVMAFDEEDKIMSKTRNEPMITQRIGNIVSHQGEKVERYPEGFIVDKSAKPALFIPIEK